MERVWLFPGGPVLAEGGLHEVDRDEGHLQPPVSRHTSTIVHQHTSSPTTPKPYYLTPPAAQGPTSTAPHTGGRPAVRLVGQASIALVSPGSVTSANDPPSRQSDGMLFASVVWISSIIEAFSP